MSDEGIGEQDNEGSGADSVLLFLIGWIWWFAFGRSFVSGRLRAVLQETSSMRASRPAPTSTTGRASSTVGLSNLLLIPIPKKRPGEFFPHRGF